MITPDMIKYLRLLGICVVTHNAAITIIVMSGIKPKLKNMLNKPELSAAIAKIPHIEAVIIRTIKNFERKAVNLGKWIFISRNSM